MTRKTPQAIQPGHAAQPGTPSPFDYQATPSILSKEMQSAGNRHKQALASISLAPRVFRVYARAKP